MSTYASPLSSGKTSPKGFLRVFGKIFSGSGVVEDTALTVSAQDTPDMTVKVSGSALDDNAVFIHTDGTFIQAWNESDANVTISANASGVTKTDAIVAYVDLTDYDADNANNPDSLKFIAVRLAGSETGAPDDTDIKATDVSTNPYIVLAEVTVANGAASINSGNITDKREVAQVDGKYLKGESVDTDQLADNAVEAAKLGSVVTSSSLNIALNDASITSTSYALIYGGSTSLGIYEVVGTVNISSLAIPSGAVILQVHCWVNAAGNLSHEAYAPLAVTSVTNTSVSFKGQVAGDGSGSNNFINQTNSKLQLFVRYIA